MPRKYYDDRFEKQKNLEAAEGLFVAPAMKAAAGADEPTGRTLERRRNKDKPLPKVFVRYDEGAALYSMSLHTFMRLAADAKAVYKVNRISLVNTKIFEEYLETFREC